MLGGCQSMTRRTSPAVHFADFAIQCPYTEAPPVVLPEVLRVLIAFAESRVRGANVASTLQVRQRQAAGWQRRVWRRATCSVEPCRSSTALARVFRLGRARNPCMLAMCGVG